MKPFRVICPFLIALHFPRWPIFYNICSLLSELEALFRLPPSPPSLLLFCFSTASLNIFLSSSPALRLHLQLEQIHPSLPSLCLHALTLLISSNLPLLHFLSSPLSLSLLWAKPLILYAHFLPVLRLPHAVSSSNQSLLFIHNPVFFLCHLPPTLCFSPPPLSPPITFQPFIFCLSSPPLLMLPSSLFCF